MQILDKEALAWFRKKVSQPTDQKSKKISETWSEEARQSAFFSARVAKGDILEGLRKRIDDVLSGNMTQQQARWWIREFLTTAGASSLRELGWLPNEADMNENDNLTELGAVRRLNLILDQNIRMAQAVGEYQRLQGDKDLFPFARYVTRDDVRVRPAHAALNGKIFRADAPELARIYPPNDFGCRCHIEPLMEDEIGKQKVSGPADIPAEGLSESGYSFNPAAGMDNLKPPKPQWGDDIRDEYLADVAQVEKPAGKPVSDAVTIKKSAISDAAHETLGAIDQVHGDGDLVPIPIEETTSNRYLGSFWRDRNFGPERIKVYRDGDHPQMTTAHEMGHYLDNHLWRMAGGKGGAGFASHMSSVTGDWQDAVTASDAYRQIKGIGGGYANDYLLAWHELWARSYAQYIAKKSGNKQMLDQLEKLQKNGYQWQDNDFSLIYASIDAIFADKGWIVYGK
jgi:SPP1 gp7 family putative phage head morphogenesis protein